MGDPNSLADMKPVSITYSRALLFACGFILIPAVLGPMGVGALGEEVREQDTDRNLELPQNARRLARAFELAAHVQNGRGRYPQRDLLLATEAILATDRFQLPRAWAAEQALRDSLANCGGLPLPGHTDTVNALAVSPDGRWLASASTDHTVRLWDLTGGDSSGPPHTLGKHEDSVRVLAFSPDGRWLVSGSYDKTAKLWDRSSGNVKTVARVLEGHAGPVRAVAFSPGGRWLVTSGYLHMGVKGGNLAPRLWDLSADNPAASPTLLKGHERPVLAATFSPDGRWLATGSVDRTVGVWDFTSRKPANAKPRVLDGPSSYVLDVAFTPDSKRLISLSADRALRIWQAGADGFSGPVVIKNAHKEWRCSMKVSMDGRWLVTGSKDGLVRVWDLRSDSLGGPSLSLNSHGHSADVIAISPDSRWLASAGQEPAAAEGNIYNVKLWDLTAKDIATSVKTLKGHEGPVRSLSFTPDGRRLFSGGLDGIIRAWSMDQTHHAAAPEVIRPHHGWIPRVAVSPDSRWLVSVGQGPTGGICVLRLGEEPPSPRIITDRGGEDAAFSSDSRWMAVVSHDVQIHDVGATHTGTPFTYRPDSRWGLSAVGFSPDRKWMAVGTKDGTTWLWDVQDRDPYATPVLLRGHTSEIQAVAFSRDRRLLATAGHDFVVGLWSLGRKDIARARVLLKGHKGPVEAAAFTADGHWLVSASRDSTARMWDLTAEDVPSACKVLEGHAAIVWGVVLTSDSARAITVSSDRTARIWDLKSDSPSLSSMVLQGHAALVYSLALTPDDRWLVTGSDDGTARIWDLAAESPGGSSIVLKGHEANVRAVAVSPDGKWAITGTTKGTVRIWPLGVEELVRLARKHVGRNLTEEEWTTYFPGEEYRKTFADWP